ncbi:OmpA family protein [Undibacterium fentianense]|uniref:OmpA family protein n=1 Tax=Undibacterium fentianense TaxID=2828728 RepID=A0A941E410_9BURK|nr:OmpA family protein [Undibacterium fentianense]MBR7799333.1 OmpA family protein [Undibacterium fentianense]
MTASVPTANAQTSPSPANKQLTPAQERYSDQRIAVDLKLYDAQQERLRTLNMTGKHPLNDYSMAKAQCWLDVSRHEYSRNDRSPFPQDALDQSILISEYLEQDGDKVDPRNPALKTPFINGAKHLRDDLEAQILALKSVPGFSCVAALVACAEVELVHAGNEFQQQQWRHAQPYIGIAEQLIDRAKAEHGLCPQQNVAKTTEVVQESAPVKVVEVESVSQTSVENWTLNGDALFKFDRVDIDGLLPAGRLAVDELIQAIKSHYAQIDRIQITGHTDHFGPIRYNEKLSKQRAETLRHFFIARGLTNPISTQGMGPHQPIKKCPNDMSRTKQIQCLQENRRVEIAVIGVQKKK